MATPKPFTMSKPEAVVTLNEIFDGYKDHFDSHRISTELTMLELLRKTHPEYHITCVSPTRFDLFGYADAGHAKTVLDCDELTMDATRTYKAQSTGAMSLQQEMAFVLGFGAPKPVGSRTDATEGELSNQVRFGRWRYHWDGREYVVYEIEYPESVRGQPVKLFFILSPRSEYSAKEGKYSETDQLLLAVGGWTTQLHDEIYVFDDAYWSKSKELWKSVQGSSWDDVILSPTMKSNLIRDVQGFFDNRALYKKLAVPWKRGVILHGVPGNGKTISIKALVNALYNRPDPVPSLYVKNLDACQGEKHSIKLIFEHARKMAPCLLIFEDLDSLVTDEIRSYFLNEVDGLESNDGILMIGSTNHLSQLDPAIAKRPSRFDRKYKFNLPSEAERILYCEFWRKKLEDSELVDFPDRVCEIVAKMTEGFSFAYLKELFVVVLLTIARGGTGEEEEEVVEEEKPVVVEASPSEDGHVVVEHEDAKAESTEKPAAEEVEKEKPTPKPKIKRTVPEVAIPDNLQDNIFLKVVKGQIKILIEDMDNTDDEPSEKKQVAAIPNMMKMMRPRRPRMC